MNSCHTRSKASGPGPETTAGARLSRRPARYWRRRVHVIRYGPPAGKVPRWRGKVRLHLGDSETATLAGLTHRLYMSVAVRAAVFDRRISRGNPNPSLGLLNTHWRQDLSCLAARDLV